MTADRASRGSAPRRGVALAVLCAIVAAGSRVARIEGSRPAAPAQLAGCTWQRAGELPLAIYDAAGTVDLAAGQLYVHGGVDRDGAVRDELYRLDLRSDQPPVERLSTTGASVPRWGHTLTWVLDGQRSKLYAIGGNTERGDDAPADNRVFTLDADGNRWQPVALSGGALGVQDHASAFDPVHRVIVVHGGRTNTGRGDVAEPRDATYFVDVGANHVTLGPRGPKLYSHSMVWDAAGQRMLVFGGTPDGQRGTSTVHALHLGNGPGLAEWTTLTVGGTAPGPRFNHGAALDPDRKAMIVYGGLKGLGEPLMDTWGLDLSKPGVATWVDLKLSNAKRSGMVMHYNPLRRLTLQISGGRPLSPESTRDIFALHCAEVGPTLPPPGTVVLPPTSPAETVILPTERTPTPTGTRTSETATTPGTPRPTDTPTPSQTLTPGPGTVLPPPLTVAATGSATLSPTPTGIASAATPSPTLTPGPGTVLPPPQTVPATASATGEATASATPTGIDATVTASATTMATNPATAAIPATPTPTGTVPTPTPTAATSTQTATSSPTGSPPINATSSPTTSAATSSVTPSTPSSASPTTPTPASTPTPSATRDPQHGRMAWLPYCGLAAPPTTATSRPVPTTPRPPPTLPPTRAPTPGTPATAPTPSVTPRPSTATATARPSTATPIPCLLAEEEPNNALLEALDRPPLCHDRAATGSLPPGDDSDHWRMEAPGAGLIKADLRNIPAGTNYDLYLYTRQGQLLAISQRPGSEDEHVEARVTAGGDYYLRVYASVGRSEALYEVRWAEGP